MKVYPNYAYCERSSHKSYNMLAVFSCKQALAEENLSGRNLLTQEEVSDRTSNCTASYVLTNSHKIRGGAA